MSFLSDLQPIPRAITITLIAAAGCTGIYFAAKTGALVNWPLPFYPWQILTLVAWAVSKSAIASGGRLDGGAIGAEIPSGSKEGSTTSESPHYFMPAGWAFAIWAPILLGETALAIYQALPTHGVAKATVWLSLLSPWLSAAFLLQACWCASFRKWAKDAGLLWFPTLLLIGTALCLDRAHHVLRVAESAGSVSLLQYFLVNLPVSLHFGWITCAALVNLNKYIGGVSRFSNNVKFAFSMVSIAIAVLLAVGVTAKTGDPVYAAVVAWALLAVAGKGGAENMERPGVTDMASAPEEPNTDTPLMTTSGGVESSKLKSEAVVSWVGAGICVAAAILFIFL
ncbi:unnamed protein product [Ascophyllum nodosum]